ncbi:MAG: TIGR03032 family protein [Pseudomonadales bacterium]|nr:TIGR03032 family protein [Pseudomonadales bacterium]
MLLPNDPAQPTGSTSDAPSKLEIDASRNFPGWLLEQKVSLAFTTYQTGKLFFVGVQDNGRLSIFERTFNRCMGLYADSAAENLYMSSLYQLWRFTPAFQQGQQFEGFDKLYVPQVGYTTGDIDIHDIALAADNTPIFVSTLFSCIAKLSDTHSFTPLWKPPWISKLAAEDRCHLNGLAMVDGKPRYVTSVSQSDVAEGWREHRHSGGILFDLATNEVVVDGLCMPHSPRVYRNKIWLLDSGSGYFGYADIRAGKFERVAFCPGFLRGLCFVGDYAIVGMSLGRHNKTFQGLPLDKYLADKQAASRCGLQVIDLNTGSVVHGFRLSGVVEELYDVVALPGVKRPMALGFKSDQIRHLVSIDGSAIKN